MGVKVTFFYRNHKAGYSIHKVMRPVIEGTPASQIVEMPNVGASPLQIFKNLIYAWKHRNKGGINHITGDVHYLSLALPVRNTMTTVHDVVSIMYNHYPQIKRFIIKFLFVNTLKRNRFLVCISEKTKKEVLSLVNFPKERIFVIPDPVDDSFQYVEHSFNSICPTILHLGTKSNKNLKRSIEAMADLKVKLRIIGKLDEDDKDLLKKYNIDYTIANNLTDEQIREEYAKCDFVSFPSLYEGFGMPILEAQATGRVCITSNIEPMKTVAGGGALLVDPQNVSSIRSAYEKIINDGKLRKELIHQGLVNIMQYREEHIVEMYHEVYSRFNQKEL